MKTKLLLLVIFYSLLSFSQQKSIMQPAIVESYQKLDSVEAFSTFLLRPTNGSSIDQVSEKWIVKNYDSDKNPTEIMYYRLLDENLQPSNDSIKILINHYSYNNFTTDFRNFMFSKTGHTGQVENIFSLFNLKSKEEEIYNPLLEQWVPSFYNEQLSDLRYPHATNINTIQHTYDSNYNLTYISKNESQVELNGLGYLSETTYFSWDSVNGFIPDYKYNYYNTYNADNKLIESIIKKIDDIPSGVETNIEKYILSYSDLLFESIYYSWSEILNDWILVSKKSITYINGRPATIYLYLWQNNSWEIDVNYNNENSNNFYYYNNNYNGYTYTKNMGSHERDINYTLEYNNDDLVNRIIYNDVYIAPMSGSTDGYTSEKEFYYSSDANLLLSDNLLNALNIYPNPVTKTIYLNLDSEIKFVISSLDGKTILKGTTNNSIDVGDLTAGIYLLNLKNNSGSITKKIIVK